MIQSQFYLLLRIFLLLKGPSYFVKLSLKITYYFKIMKLINYKILIILFLKKS